jgi:hypothetical protein
MMSKSPSAAHTCKAPSGTSRVLKANKGLSARTEVLQLNVHLQCSSTGYNVLKTSLPLHCAAGGSQVFKPRHGLSTTSKVFVDTTPEREERQNQHQQWDQHDEHVPKSSAHLPSHNAALRHMEQSTQNKPEALAHGAEYA